MLVFAVDDPEPFEEKTVIDDDRMAAVRDDDLGKAAGGDDSGFLAQLIGKPVDHAVQHGGAAQNNAAAHAFDGIFSDGMSGRFQADVMELGGPLGQRFQGDPHTGHDGSTDVIVIFVHTGDGGGGAHVNDEERCFIFFDAGDCRYDQVAADGGRIVHDDVETCFQTGPN